MTFFLTAIAAITGIKTIRNALVYYYLIILDIFLQITTKINVKSLSLETFVVYIFEIIEYYCNYK